jgi:signal transduction histidine kinase
VEVEAELGEVLAHRDTTGLIFANLISNGLKFVPRDRAPRVRVGAQRRAGRIRVSVSDNGIGIAASDRTRVFQPFERLPTADVYAGSGLGLALVARGVERMNGCYGVDTNHEGGTDFWFELPAAD